MDSKDRAGGVASRRPGIADPLAKGLSEAASPEELQQDVGRISKPVPVTPSRSRTARTESEQGAVRRLRDDGANRRTGRFKGSLR